MFHGLNRFISFDFPSFSKDKEFQVMGIKPRYEDKDKQKEIGTAVEVAIVKDQTTYYDKNNNIDSSVTNLYEKFSIKLEQRKETLGVKIGDFVEIIGATAVVYGEYRNQLSVKADDIRVIEP